MDKSDPNYGSRNPWCADRFDGSKSRLIDCEHKACLKIKLCEFTYFSNNANFIMNLFYFTST